jgi:hypothetical protein
MRKLIAIILMAATTAAAQTQYVVNTDGTIFFSKGGSGVYTNIGDVRGTFRPSYGCFKLGATPILTAQSVVVSNGTISSGTVTNTRTIDDVYLVVNESGSFNVDFLFSNGGSTPHVIDFKGRYEGNNPHNIKVQMYDYTNSVWTNITSAVDDLPSSTEDSNLKWQVPSPEEYFRATNNITEVRFQHSGVAIGAHNAYFDYISVLYGQVSLPTAGVYQTISDVLICSTNFMGADTNTATFTMLADGDFDIWIGGSGTGSSNTKYTVDIFTNGVLNDCKFARTIDVEGSFGNASDRSIITLLSNDTVQAKIKANKDDAFASFENFHIVLKKAGNTP